jgi:hypothetical protein
MTECAPAFSSNNHAKPEPDVKQVEAAWREFLAARERAEKTKAIADGIAMAHAMRDFLALFCPTAGRPL